MRIWAMSFAMLVSCSSPNSDGPDADGPDADGPDAAGPAEDLGPLPNKPDAEVADGSVDLGGVPVEDAAPADLGGDMSPSDAGPPDSGVAGPGCSPEDPCPAACAWYADCSADLCGGYEDQDRQGVLDGCRAACSSTRGLGPVICRHTQCEQTVEVARAAVSGFAALCDGPSRGPECPAEGDRCPTVGQWAADCAIQACPGFGPEDRLDLTVRWAGVCGDVPALADLICDDPGCEESLAAFRQLDFDFPAACDEGAAGPANAWGPSARVTSLDIPRDPRAAFAARCDVVGSARGSSLGALAQLVEGGLAASVVPDRNGQIPYVLLGQLDGWPAGLTGDQVGEVTLNLFEGAHDDGRFTLARDAFVGSDPAQGPLNTFPHTSVTQQVLLTATGEVSLHLPLLPQIQGAFLVSGARLQGELGIQREGFEVRNGLLTGYITHQAMIDFLVDLFDQCRAEPENPTCSSLLPLFGGIDADPEDAYAVLDALSPHDVAYQDGVATACEAGECNATSVCLLMGMTPVTIEGVVP